MNAQGFLKFENELDLGALEGTLLSLFSMQAAKIGKYKGLVEGILNDSAVTTTEMKLTSIIELMEEHDKEALYQVQKFLPVSNARDVFEPIRMKLALALGVHDTRLLIEGPALFINRPNTQRLLYKWHSEAHYYPKRRRFINIWLPIFRAKTKVNGAMSFKVGSHLHEWPFAEYTGYNKDTENKANHFVQYEVPENFLTGFEEYVCESEPGDVYLFHRNLVHRSNANTTGDYSFAVVARAWTPEDDLTLSGRMEATPYGGDIGRSGLEVEVNV